MNCHVTLFVFVAAFFASPALSQQMPASQGIEAIYEILVDMSAQLETLVDVPAEDLVIKSYESELNAVKVYIGNLPSTSGDMFTFFNYAQVLKAFGLTVDQIAISLSDGIGERTDDVENQSEGARMTKVEALNRYLVLSNRYVDVTDKLQEKFNLWSGSLIDGLRPSLRDLRMSVLKSNSHFFKILCHVQKDPENLLGTEAQGNAATLIGSIRASVDKVINNCRGVPWCLLTLIGEAEDIKTDTDCPSRKQST